LDPIPLEAMLKNYLMISLRNLRKQPGYSVVNVLGLALGMAACMLILLYVRSELTYDRFNEKADRMYRVVYSSESGGSITDWAYSHSSWGEQFAAFFPEVEKSTRIIGDLGDEGNLFAYEDRSFIEHDFYWADSTVFDMFTLPLISGDPKMALAAPFSIVLSETTARKYFGDADPLGKTLTFNNTRQGYAVTGVFKDLPENTHLPFDLLASYSTILQDVPDLATVWQYTYVLLQEGTSAASIQAKTPAFIARNVPRDGFLASLTRIDLQPLTDLHLHSNRQGEPSPPGNPSTIYVFAVIALLILGIACINFMNLATARAANRFREIGMRKVMGARRDQLVVQFIGEAVLLCGVGFLLALILADAALPVFNNLSGKSLAPDALRNAPMLLALAGLAVVVGTLAGSYPALYLSRFQATSVLKGGSPRGSRKAVLRQGLVVAQFAVSIGLIICTGVVYDQLQYMKHKRLGFDKEQLLSIPVEGTPVMEPANFDPFKQQILQNPAIEAVTTSSNRLGERIWIWNLRPEGWRAEEDWIINAIIVGEDYIKTYGMQITAGRDFTAGHDSDQTADVILNESAVRFLGWNEPLSKRILLPANSPDGERPAGTVIGVVKDFNFASLHTEVAPLVLLPGAFSRYVIVRINTEDTAGALKHLERQWSTFVPQSPLQYAFVDEQFDELYRAEQRMSGVVTTFAILAVLIACLGLLGLAAYTTEQRRKEIGVRKVLGATVSNIVLLLSGDFARLVVISFVVAAPIAYLVMKWWLEDFAYQVRIPLELFPLAGLAVLVIAILAVSYQSLKAALADPVKSLRYE
jgi:putative ABC transport system permease protein